MNICDLFFTIRAYGLGQFTELNPLARNMLEHPYAVETFKLGTVAFATVVLLCFRQHRWVEIGCWGLCGVYIVLSYLWLQYFNHLYSQPDTISYLITWG